MSFQLPSHYKLLFDEGQIAKRIGEIALDVKAWVDAERSISSDDPIALCVLRGAVFFFADLTRAINSSLDLEFVRYNTYDPSNNQQLPDAALSKLHLPMDLNGRAVLIIDDICESGRLFSLLKKECLNLGARTVKTASLVYRDIPRSTFCPDYYCFKLATEDWLVGYGLDDTDRFRNVPAVYEIIRSDV